MTDTSSVSVVIATRDQRYLSATLDALGQQSGGPFEVVIVENGGRVSGVKDLVKQYQGVIDCRYHFLSQDGANKARNFGVSRSKFPIVAFTDDDCIPSETWIESIVNCFRRWPQAEIAGGPTILEFESAPPQWLVGPFRHWLSEVDWGEEERPLTGTEYLVSANMAIRRGTLEHHSGLQTYVAAEASKHSFIPENDELEIQNLVKSTSASQVIYTPTISVRHRIATTRLNLDWMVDRNYGQGRSDILLAAQTVDIKVSELKEILLNSMQPEDWLAYMRLPFDYSQAFDRTEYELNFLQCKLAYWRGAIDQISDLS